MRRKPEKRRRSAASPSNLKLQRWIDLIAALLSRRYGTSFETLKRDVPGYGGPKDGASVARMFERDKDELRAFGIPIEELKGSDDDEHRYVIDAKELYLPFLAMASSRTATPRILPREGYRSLSTLYLEPDETESVLRGANSARVLADPDLDADLDSAIRKLNFDLVLAPVPSQSGNVHLRSDDAQEESASLRTIGEALLRHKHISFDYRTIGRENAGGRRTVEPYGLFFNTGHWYLAARDRDKEGVRNFRVSRMSNLAKNEAKHQTPDFAIPRAFNLTEHAGSREPWELGDGDFEDMILEFRGESGATLAAAKLGTAVPASPRQRMFRVKRVDAFVRWILSFAGEVVPVSPASLSTDYQEMVRRTLSTYSKAES